MHRRSQAGIALCKYNNGEVQCRPKGRLGERPSRFRRSQDVSHKWNLRALRGSKDSQDLIKSRKRGGVFRCGIHQYKDGRGKLSGWLSPRESMSSEKSTRSWEHELFTGWPASEKKPEKGEKTEEVPHAEAKGGVFQEGGSGRQSELRALRGHEFPCRRVALGLAEPFQCHCMSGAQLLWAEERVAKEGDTVNLDNVS